MNATTFNPARKWVLLELVDAQSFYDHGLRKGLASVVIITLQGYGTTTSVHLWYPYELEQAATECHLFYQRNRYPMKS